MHQQDHPPHRKVTIGNATLYCGDSLELLRQGVLGKLGAVVSDPPYGIGYQHGGNGKGFAAVRNMNPILGDDVPFDPRPWIEAAPMGSDGQPRIVLFGADHFRSRLPAGGTLLAWDKHVGRGSDDNFADCEWAWCGRKVKREVFRWLWKGVLSQKTKLDVSRSDGVFQRAHVSQKPVELMRWCIDKARPIAGAPVLDPYMGSGSTGVACATLGIPFVGVELDPEHFDVACKRIEAAYQSTPS